MCRIPKAAVLHLWHRVRRWWGLNVGHAIFQAIYLAALLIGGVLTFWKSFEYIDSAAMLAGGKTPSIQFGRHAWAVDWMLLTAGCCAIIIFAYKSWVTSTRRLSANEKDRRAAMAVVLRMAQRDGKNRSSTNGHEARLNEVCDCVRRDVQEFLKIPESSLSVVLLCLKSEKGPRPSDASQLHLHAAGRNRQRMDQWVHRPRPALASYAFEAIRLSRSVVFHDVRASEFAGVFPDNPRPYRTVYCLPIVGPDHPSPFAVLAVNIADPYVLWPLYQNKLDQLLVEYEVVITAFLHDEGVYAPDSQLELF